MALASSLASSALQGNTHAQQGYPAPQQSGGGVLDSIFGALGIVYIYKLNFKNVTYPYNIYI